MVLILIKPDFNHAFLIETSTSPSMAINFYSSSHQYYQEIVFHQLYTIRNYLLIEPQLIVRTTLN